MSTSPSKVTNTQWYAGLRPVTTSTGTSKLTTSEMTLKANSTSTKSKTKSVSLMVSLTFNAPWTQCGKPQKIVSCWFALATRLNKIIKTRILMLFKIITSLIPRQEPFVRLNFRLDGTRNWSLISTISAQFACSELSISRTANPLKPQFTTSTTKLKKSLLNKNGNAHIFTKMNPQQYKAEWLFTINSKTETALGSNAKLSKSSEEKKFTCTCCSAWMITLIRTYCKKPSKCLTIKERDFGKRRHNQHFDSFYFVDFFLSILIFLIFLCIKTIFHQSVSDELGVPKYLNLILQNLFVWLFPKLKNVLKTV